MDEKKDFLKGYHEGLMDNLNHISDDLLKAKWFFLATIAAIGTAYFKIFKSDKENWFAFIAVCLIGNIIFWLLSEYTLSHAFLFRFIQSKLAKIENDFKEKSKDPATKEYFLFEDNEKKRRFGTDYFIPDQFIPIYWASSWLIIINAIIATALLRRENIPLNIVNENLYINSWTRILILLFLSMPFIWKLWTYHCYKLSKFIKENCNFKIVTCKEGKCNDYFELPQKNVWIGLIIALIGLIINLIFPDKRIVHLLIILGLIISFFLVIIGFIIHLSKTIIRLDLPRLNSFFAQLFTPEIVYDSSDVVCVRFYEKWFYRVCAVLYNIT